MMLDILPQFGEFKIYAFEPHPRWYKCLRQYNIEIFPVAISDKKEKARLYHCPNEVGHSLFKSKENVTDRYFEIDCITFSDFIETIPDYKSALNIVKINIEGAEILFFRDIIKNGLLRYISIFLGTGHDIEKVGELKDHVQGYYSMLNDNNIVIHRFSDWKPEKNVDIGAMISLEIQKRPRAVISLG
jgi:FkbM family methyltransferase